jgi:hypothetical protein
MVTSREMMEMVENVVWGWRINQRRRRFGILSEELERAVRQAHPHQPARQRRYRIILTTIDRTTYAITYKHPVARSRNTARIIAIAR